MSKKYTRNYLFKMKPVDVYKLVLEGKHISKFPQGYWQQQDSISKSIECVNYLLFKILKIKNDDELLMVINIKIFKEYKLLGMLRACFNASPYELINTIFPNRYNPWEIPNAPKCVWTNENIAKATKWLIEDKLKLSDKQLKEQLSTALFIDNGLLGMLHSLKNTSPYEAINISFPGKFQPWEFNYVCRNYWNKETGKKAVKWLIEDKLQLKTDEDFANLTKKVFKDNGLYGMYQTCFDKNLYKTINEVYPNRFKPWQFKQIPQGFWKDINNCISATKWLIDEKLQINDLTKVSYSTFKQNGLSWMLSVSFDNNYKKAISVAYPKGL